MLDASGTIDVTVATGNLVVQGGTAVARNTFSASSAPSANANALMKSGGRTTIAVTNGSLMIDAGNATAEASASNSGDASAFAHASADLEVGGNLNITAVGTNVAIRGGMATAGVLGAGSNNSTCSDCNVRANANANVNANNIAFANVGGNFDLGAGTAQANISVDTYIEDLVQVRANANANISGNSVDITAGGTLAVSGGTARAGGSWTSGTATIQAHADAIINAVSNDVTLNANMLDVAGGNANIGSATSVMGDDATINATARADIDASRDVVIDAINGLSVGGGQAAAFFNSVDDSIDAVVNAHARVHAGRDMEVTVANSSVDVKGGIASAVAEAAGRPRVLDVDANADASMTANGGLKFRSVGNNVNIAAGNATANASGSCSSCDADAKADAWVSGGVVTLNNIGGDLIVQGGNADAMGTGANCSSCNMNANANAEIAGNRIVVNSLGGNLNVSVGHAQASSEDDMVTGVARAKAYAEIVASTNVSIDAGSAVNVEGGNARVEGNWSSAGNMDGLANADAIIGAGGNLNVTAVSGLNIAGGSASANPTTGGSTPGTADASAKALLKAGGVATIEVTGGDVTLAGGSSNPSSGGGSSYTGSGFSIGLRASGSSGSSPLRKASASAIVKADQLQMTAMASDGTGGSINASDADIDANGIYLHADGSIILLNTTTVVGNGTAPGVSGDTLMLDVMERAGIPLPANTAPNLKFTAGSSMFAGDIEVTADDAYLWFETDFLSGVNIYAPVSQAVVGRGAPRPGDSLTVQYSPLNGHHKISLEDQSQLPVPEQVNYNNASHIWPQPMTTVVFGSAKQTAPISVGKNGKLDIGSRNIVLLTTPDKVDSTSNIITTGIIATSGFVASVEREPAVFITPRLDSFEVETDTIWDEEEERKKRLVENSEPEHNMCTAL